MDDKPDLHDDLFFVWELFQELNAGRTFGFMANPISTESD
jgi:hypothetical protein